MAKARARRASDDVVIHTCRRCGTKSQYPPGTPAEGQICQVCAGGAPATGETPVRSADRSVAKEQTR